MEDEEDAIFNDAKTLGSKDIKEVWKIVHSAFLSDSGFKESLCALLPTCC